MKSHSGRKSGVWARLFRAVALMPILWGAAAQAAPSDANVPDSLKPWKTWALHGQEAWLCPSVEGEHDRAFCAWPGELKLEVARQGDGLQFSQNWEVQQESAVPLPGNRKYWPQQVTVDGRAHPVVMQNGLPFVWLKEGRHALKGLVSWQERPQAMDIPENVALVSLIVDGKPVFPLERHGRELNLGAKEGAAREGDSLDAQVVRKLADGIPARLTTRLFLKVSGKAREWSAANILPAHFVPVRISSPWAARLDADGRLLVQVMPGQATVEIEARLDAPLRAVEPVFSPERSQEVWSYEAHPALRTTTVLPGENMLAVDPRQAGVPPDWLSLPAFVVNGGARFQIEERSRGQNEREGQRLALQREMWLDFSGDGFFARDRIEGSMRQGWRFDVAQPYALERADSFVVPGRIVPADLSAALLVTQGASKELTGVEWHQMNVTLNAGVRLKAGASSRVPVTGWQQSFDSVDTTLRLPYGYRLIAAPGADKASGNVWTESWTILDIFLAAFFALLAWRLSGTVGGIVAVAYLMLAMQEAFAPVQSFAAVVILALLCRAVPEGRLRKILLFGERVALLCFIVWALAFIPMQIRAALYPQFEAEIPAELAFPGAAQQRDEYELGSAVPAPAQDEQAILADEAEAPAMPSPEPAPAQIAERLRLEEENAVAALSAQKEAESRVKELEGIMREQQGIVQRQGIVREPQGTIKERRLPKLGSLQASSPIRHAYKPEPRQRYAQSTVTQTGGGEPNWNIGHRYQLHWSGPVTEAQSMRLLVSPPWLTRLLRLLTVALLGWLVWHLVCVAFPGAGAASSWMKSRKAGASAPAAASALSMLCLAGFVAAGLGFSAPAAAAVGDGFPTDALLEKLKTRLLEAPACAPNCADVAKARVEADAAQVKITLVAHIEAAASLELPEPDEQMTLRGVRINGEMRPVLRVEGKNYIALQRGVHHVQLEYAVSGDAASLNFPVRPAQIEFASAHWQVDGIDEGRLLGETLNFSRAAAPTLSTGSSGEPSMPAQQFPPFVHVRRDFNFGLDWNVQTRVTRIAPEEGGFTFPVPLLLGEHVTTPEVRIQDGRALAVFASKTGTANWAARLDKAERIELRAPSLTEYAETWRITVNPSWHLEWDDGVPVTLSSAGEEVVFEFHPLPGEKLTLALTQPSKTDGGVRAIDRAKLTNSIGRHASDATLEFSLRASQGGEHLIGLPPELEVLEVRRDNVALNLQARDNKLSLPVSPGMQTYTLRLRRQGDIGFLVSSPAIDLGMPAANIGVDASLGEERWIIAVGGPNVGPAVLYWGELCVALLLAFLLAKSGISSLKRWQWFLLVLGFSTFSWMTLLCITLWLVAIDWRGRSESCAQWPDVRFNAMQAGIVAMTVVMLFCLIDTVPRGLLGVPDMGIRGHGSSGNSLSWFADRSDSLLPVVKIASLPVWLYRALMLAWTLWLASILIRWLSRGLSAWLRDGYWKKGGWASKIKERANLISGSAESAATDKSEKGGKPNEGDA
ncbi:MAG: hypothetical protein LBU76_02580 [Azoarcus sp.]|nr:hypothetical protein [Azoarcus sp.]